MKDLAKKDYLDEAKLELGTDVQFFKFGLDDVAYISIFIGIITMLLIFITPINLDLIIGGFTGAYLLLIFFYIKVGTN